MSGFKRPPWEQVRRRLHQAAGLRRARLQRAAAFYAANGYAHPYLGRLAEQAAVNYWYVDRLARTYPQFTARPKVRP